jgi:hypothetical protein
MTFDYSILENRLKRHGYSLRKSCDYIISIAKNGSCDGSDDFRINFILDKNTSIVEEWNIQGDGTKNFEEKTIIIIENLIKRTLETNKNIAFDDLCLLIATML